VDAGENPLPSQPSVGPENFLPEAGIDRRGDIGEAVLEVEEVHILAAAEAAGEARQVGAAGGALQGRHGVAGRVVVVESGLAVRPGSRVVEPALLRALRFVLALAQGRRLRLRAQARVPEPRDLVERRRHGVGGLHQRLLAEPRHGHALVETRFVHWVRRLREHVVEVVQASDLLQDVVRLRNPRHDVAGGFLVVVMQLGWRVVKLLAHAVVARHLLHASTCLAVRARPFVGHGRVRRIVHHWRQRRPRILELVPHGLAHARVGEQKAPLPSRVLLENATHHPLVLHTGNKHLSIWIWPHYVP
jgi:hypothetical protein